MLYKAASFLILISVSLYYFPKILNWYFSIAIDEANDNYDFVIVGGGTSGSVVANRLSEIPRMRVLVLEAGGEDPLNPFFKIPLLTSALQGSTADWGFVSEKNWFLSRSLHDNHLLLPRGKILGGTTAINYMIYARGSRHDYDEWESLGATGWSYKEVLPYFKKSEHVLADELRNSSERGHEGYLKVDTNTPYEATKWIFEAVKDLGLKKIDYNVEDEGFGLLQTIVTNGQRITAADAYLYPFAGRKNLDIVTHAHVTRILFETTRNNLPRAVGVEYVKNGVKFTVRSKKEVILSAGALLTPHLLMLSGVGPKEHLKEQKIPILADLPGVGQNLQDHSCVSILLDFSSNTTDGVGMSLSSTLTARNMIKYAFQGEGPFASTGVNGFSFLKVDKNNPEKKFDYPDAYFVTMILEQDYSDEFIQGQISRLLNIKQEVLKNIAQSLTAIKGNGVFQMSLLLGLSHPQSVGNIRLASKDYRDRPKINLNYFEDESDLETFLKTMRFMEKLEQTNAFKSRGIKMRMLSPFCDGNTEPPRSDEFYKCFIRNHVMTQYHQTSTAKMGPSTDPSAVTSPRLKVYKTDGLRIADASVMPKVTSANTQAPCYMIGEKVSDMIKEDWNLK